MPSAHIVTMDKQNDKRNLYCKGLMPEKQSEWPAPVVEQAAAAVADAQNVPFPGAKQQRIAHAVLAVAGEHAQDREAQLLAAVNKVCNKWSTGDPLAQMVVAEIRGAMFPYLGERD